MDIHPATHRLIILQHLHIIQGHPHTTRLHILHMGITLQSQLLLLRTLLVHIVLRPFISSHHRTIMPMTNHSLHLVLIKAIVEAQQVVHQQVLLSTQADHLSFQALPHSHPLPTLAILVNKVDLGLLMRQVGDRCRHRRHTCSRVS